jgi:hypothetical protein
VAVIVEIPKSVAGLVLAFGQAAQISEYYGTNDRSANRAKNGTHVLSSNVLGKFSAAGRCGSLVLAEIGRSRIQIERLIRNG